MRRLFFRGYGGGLSNKRLSLDLGVGLALLTGRTLAPYAFSAPVRFSPDSLEGGRETRPVASLLDILDVPVAWEGEHLAAPEPLMPVDRKLSWAPCYDSLFYYPANLPIDVGAFADFRNGRSTFYTFDGETDAAPAVQVDAATLGLYSTYFFLERRRQRELIRAMGRILPKPPYAAFAAEVSATLGPFDAVHLRRGDFVQHRCTPRVADVSGDEVASNLKSRLDPGVPLVICTDDSTDRAFFDPLVRAFPRAVFLDRLLQGAEWRARFDALPRNDDIVLSLVTQLVAERARSFVGTLYSTFTALIHRARGFQGRGEPFLYAFADWPPSAVRYERCEYRPTCGDGTYSWNRTRFPLGPDGYCWAREWPEAFTLPDGEPEDAEGERVAGAIVLRAEDASVHGAAARLDRHGGEGHIGHWTDPGDEVSWDIVLDAPRRVRVEVRYACPPESAGAVFRIGVDGERAAEGTVGATPSWTAFSRWEEVGEVRLPAGRRRLRVRARAMPRGAVMNLRGVRLVRLFG